MVVEVLGHLTYAILSETLMYEIFKTFTEYDCFSC